MSGGWRSPNKHRTAALQRGCLMEKAWLPAEHPRDYTKEATRRGRGRPADGNDRSRSSSAGGRSGVPIVGGENASFDRGNPGPILVSIPLADKGLPGPFTAGSAGSPGHGLLPFLSQVADGMKSAKKPHNSWLFFGFTDEALFPPPGTPGPPPGDWIWQPGLLKRDPPLRAGSPVRSISFLTKNNPHFFKSPSPSVVRAPSVVRVHTYPESLCSPGPSVARVLPGPSVVRAPQWSESLRVQNLPRRAPPPAA